MHLSLPHVTATGLLLCALIMSPPTVAGQSQAVGRGDGADAMLVVERASPLPAAGARPVSRAAVPHQEHWFSAAAHTEFGRQDRVRRGLTGAGIGAFLGAAGFATFTYLANDGGQGSDYWPLALGVGGVAGGAVGFIVGISSAW